MIHAFPKIFALGQPYIKDIFDGEVEITEKVDGSQFVFGKIDGQLYMRSKGQQIFPENPQRMFREAVDYVVSIQDHPLLNDTVYYCEYLQKPKHNVLAYADIPRNHLALFAAFGLKKQEFFKGYDWLRHLAEKLDISVVPCIYQGAMHKVDLNFDDLLSKDSFLGAAKIEGFVVKNYNKPFLLGGQPIPIMAGKYVSEAFKEKHRGAWKGEHTSQGKWDKFKEIFRAEPRWHKAIQHLRDSGLLEESPKDIGNLLKEIQRDITEEEQHNIKDFLWEYFGSELLRHSVKGFPEFYKRHLMGEAQNGNIH